MSEVMVGSSSNFIQQKIDQDLKEGKNQGRVITRFPPEPNGYLHIGHAKSICLNFGLAQKYSGLCHLRLDDTNPTKEDQEYVDAIQEDIRWLGFQWDALYYASDYFEKIYEFAVQIVKMGKAFVCDLTAEQIRLSRGTLTEPGMESPFRDRSIQENLNLLDRMRQGEFEEGTRVLRAKINMASPNLNLRDPVLYRIRKAEHHRTKNQWCLYPMYDFAHPISDMIEGITHSLCTLEFEDHRPFYDWVLDTLKTPIHPQQIEFARLNLNFTLMSKRKLFELVQSGVVQGWDDPRMPTLQGMRRRGVPASAIRQFCERVGITKKESCIEMGLLETCIREDLEHRAPRVLSVLKPLRVVIENYPEHQVEEFEIPYHPKNPELGMRKVAFSRVVYLEQEDFQEHPPAGYFRLSVGREVRLRGAYFIRCLGFEKDPQTGAIIKLRCVYDPDTYGGKNPPDGRRVKATLHWVSEAHSVQAEVRLYDRLFQVPFPSVEGQDALKYLNPQSLIRLTQARLERSLLHAQPESIYQFERQGYFCVDRYDAQFGSPVWNRIVTLKDSWTQGS